MPSCAMQDGIVHDVHYAVLCRQWTMTSCIAHSSIVTGNGVTLYIFSQVKQRSAHTIPEWATRQILPNIKRELSNTLLIVWCLWVDSTHYLYGVCEMSAGLQETG